MKVTIQINLANPWRSDFVIDIPLKVISTVGTAIHTVYIRCNYLHCAQKVQLSTLSAVHKKLHCLQQVQLSTLSTVGTTLYIVYSRYNYLHYLQQVQLYTLSTNGTTIYTVYSRYNYLYCLQ